jgi:hypothetical protein
MPLSRDLVAVQKVHVRPLAAHPKLAASYRVSSVRAAALGPVEPSAASPAPTWGRAQLHAGLMRPLLLGGGPRTRAGASNDTTRDDPLIDYQASLESARPWGSLRLGQPLVAVWARAVAARCRGDEQERRRRRARQAGHRAALGEPAAVTRPSRPAVGSGKSVIVVEHHQALMAYADLDHRPGPRRWPRLRLHGNRGHLL